MEISALLPEKMDFFGTCGIQKFRKVKWNQMGKFVNKLLFYESALLTIPGFPPSIPGELFDRLRNVFTFAPNKLINQALDERW